MAACQLACFDCELIIIDQKAAPTVESRAMILTPRSLEIYQQTGWGAGLLKKSKPIPDVSFFIDGQQKATFDISGAGSDLTELPDFKAFEQFKNEKLLYQFLKRTGRTYIGTRNLRTYDSKEKKSWCKRAGRRKAQLTP